MLPELTSSVSQRNNWKHKKMLESTTKLTSQQYEVGMLWIEAKPNLAIEITTHHLLMSQFYSSEQSFQKDRNQIGFYQQSIDTDAAKELAKILYASKVKGPFGKDWNLPHHPVLNPNKCWKVRRVCNAASKYKDVCLMDKLLARLDLLQGLTEADIVKD